MRRPASSTLPSYAPEYRHATESAQLYRANNAPAGRWSTRTWLLLYLALGFYAIAVFGVFVIGWTPWLAPHKAQQETEEQHHLQHNYQKLPVVDPIKVEMNAKDQNELQEDWPVQEPQHGEGGLGDAIRGMELEQEQRRAQAAGAHEDENIGASLDEDIEPVGTEKTAEASITTMPLTLSSTTISSISGLTEAEDYKSTKKDVEIPTRQNDVILLIAKEEVKKKDATLVSDVKNSLGESEAGYGEDPNEAEADIQAPQEKWEVGDSSESDATETADPLLPSMIDETKPPVRRSPEFMKALDLVYLPETNPPNPYFHVFPVRKNTPEQDAALLSALRNNAADLDAWTAEEHQHELDRLEGIKREANEDTERLKRLVNAANKLITEEKNRLEDIRAVSTLSLRLSEPRKIRKNLKCMGWRQTGQCDPYGNREPEFDLGCNRIAPGGVSGYCEVLDEDTGEAFRVMQLNCSSLREHVAFSCAQATDFANFGLTAQGVYENALAQNASDPLKLLGNQGSGNGIVMVVYPKLLSSVFASISVLRSYNCTLPIELWISQPELVRTPRMGTTLSMLQQRFSNLIVETITDPTIAGFSTKIHAVQHSKFENVLFLDADNVPVRDPTFLFESQEYREHGAIFWPDFWHPEKTIFNIHRNSLLWELVDLPFVDMFEQESGQLLINRKRAALALEVLMFFAYHRPSHFERLAVVHGDKDLFRLAWMKSQTPFYMMPFPPGVAGTQRGTIDRQDKLFCGMTMVQFDVDGNVLFLHRNSKKLSGDVNRLDVKYWTHLLTFKWEQEIAVGDGEEVVSQTNRTAVQRMMSFEKIKQKYQIGCKPSNVHFKELKSCYGAEINVEDSFNMTRFEDLRFANLEQELVDYAHEAALVMVQG